MTAFVRWLCVLLSVQAVYAQNYWNPRSMASGGTITGTLTFNDDIQSQWGTSGDFVCEYDTAQTPDAMVCGVSADSRNWIVTEKADVGTDFGHGLQNNPTLWIHSSDATAPSEYISIARGTTNAQFTSGFAGFDFSPSVGGGFRLLGATFTSGSTNDYGIQSAQTLNDAGAAGGADVYRALYANLTTTNTTGWDNVYLLDLVDDTVSRFRVSADGQTDHTIAALTGNQVGFDGTYTTSNTTNGPIIGHIITLGAGFTGSGLTQSMVFDNIVAGTSATYSTDGTYGSRPGGNRGMGGYTRATTTGINTGLMGLARGGIVNWGTWAGATDPEANKANVGLIGLGFNDAAGGEGIGVYAIYDNPSAQPNISADLKTAFLADNVANAVDIAVFRDNTVEVFAIQDFGSLTWTPTASTSGNQSYMVFTSPTDTGLTASTEVIGHSYSGANKTWATGAITLQREFAYGQPTYGFAGASTMTLGATLAVLAGPTEGTNATITSGAAILAGGTTSVDVSGNYSNIFVVPNPVATGVGNLNAWYGINYATGMSVSLGNQTASLDELAAYKNSATTFVSTTNTRTVALAAGALFNAHTAGTNVTFTESHGLMVDTGTTRLDDALLWGAGTAVVAGRYSIQRNADATNVLQSEVPTGASHEWSVNDVAQLTLNATTLGLATNTITGVGTAITGTANTALAISVPDQGVNTNAGVGLTIQADDGGSSGAGAAGGNLTLIAGDGQGTGPSAGGDVIVRLGANVGATSPGVFEVQNSSSNTIGMIQGVNGTNFGLATADSTTDFMFGFQDGATFRSALIIDQVATAVNQLTVVNAVTTASPTLSATGTDTNIDLTLAPKGTGAVVVTKASAGPALDLNVTATAYTTEVGVLDLRRTGALTGVNTEQIAEVIVRPAFTLTEPGAGSTEYVGMDIDLGTLAVTAGAGSSVVTGLLISGSADADIGTSRAIVVETGIAEFDGGVDLGSAGVRLTDDGDGAVTLLGLGDGSDEDLTLNLDDTANTVVLSSSTGVTSLTLTSMGLTSTATGSMGWTPVNAANQACNTTCTSACIVGIDVITTGFLACTDATADSCLCAGAS